MIRCISGRRTPSVRDIFVCATALALAGTFAGCEEDTKPYITKLAASPLCGTMGVGADSTLAPGLTVDFFGRASSGNRFDDPTGANSALKWSWDFDGDGRIDARDDVRPSFRYGRPGDYTATLIVVDDDGDQDAQSILVQVRDESSDLDLLHFDADVTEELLFARRAPRNNALNSDGVERPIRGVDDEDFIPVPVPEDDLPLFERFVFNAQQDFDGWQATFDGALSSTCQITDIFSQYDWQWGFDTGQVVSDRDPVVLEFSPSQVTRVIGTVSATDIVTGVERRTAVATDMPIGVRIESPRLQYVAPGATDTVAVYGYYLDGLRDLDFGIELPATTTIDGVELEQDFVDRGFQAAASESLSNFWKVSFSSESPVDVPDVESLLGRVIFTNSPDTLSFPQQRNLFLRGAIAVRDTINPTMTTTPGSYLADVDDCNDNGLGDTLELLSRRRFVDRSGDDVLDYCQDCNADGEVDGEQIAAQDGSLLDVDVNGVLDECDCNGDGQFDAVQLTDPEQSGLDQDGDGVIDACDCDFNGQLDLDEIRAAIASETNPARFRFQDDPALADSLEYVTVPYNRAYDYVAEIDRIDSNPLNDPDGGGAEPDGILDFCQDCDENGALDFLQFTPSLDPQLAQALGLTANDGTRLLADIDRNGLLDVCDCDGDDRFDRGELIQDPSLDGNGDDLIDECDCNGNDVSDLLDIAAVATVQQVAGIFTYVSTLDVNNDQFIDGCDDCDENGTLDGPQLIADPTIDIDGNRLIDECDCNGDLRLGPPIEVLVNQGQDTIANPACDCDLDRVIDLRQIAESTTSVNVVDGVVQGYTSPIDEITIVNPNPDPLPPNVSEAQEVLYEPGSDGIPDRCQDCDDNGVADVVEGSLDRRLLALIGENVPNRRDIDRNGFLDVCDCDSDERLDQVQIEENPGLDTDGDGLDACDCDGNNEIDILEIAEFAVFEENDLGDPIYVNAPGLDENGDFRLDECPPLKVAGEDGSPDVLRPLNAERR